MPLLQSKQPILLPVNPAFVFGTLFISLILNCFPFSGLIFVPDFVALTLAFWAVYQPRLVSMGTGFLLGLLMDVLYTATLGQYALAYVLLAYASNTFSRRIQGFSLIKQIFHMFPLFIGTCLIVGITSVIIYGQFPKWMYFSSSVTAALLWPVWNILLLAPQRRAVEKDENRPI